MRRKETVMFFVFLGFLAFLSSLASAQSAPATCAGLEKEARASCLDAKLADLQLQVENNRCDASACAPAAPAAAPTPTGPSRIRRDHDQLRKEFDALKAEIEGMTVPDFDDFERRLKELEDRAQQEAAEPAGEQGGDTITPSPIYTPVPGPQGPPGTDGRDGVDGRPGRDGRSAEFSVFTGVSYARAKKNNWNFTAFEIGGTFGGRPVSWLGLGGFASGHVLEVDSLGFAAGGYALLRPAPNKRWRWFDVPVEVAWREAAFGIKTTWADHVVRGVGTQIGLQATAPKKPGKWSSGLTAKVMAGAWYPGAEDGTVFTFNAGAGWVF